MKVLVVGSGVREHAIAWKLAQSERLTQLHAAPGNPGIAEYAKCHDIPAHDIEAVQALVTQLGIDLVVVGPEGPLVAGLSNRLKKFGIPCVGPSAAGARIEGSKVFAKELMDRVQVPTARWEAFSDVQAALAAINRWRGPVVIKADGPAGGMGTFVCMSKVQAERALNMLLVDAAFGVAGRRVVVEEFLQGTEASITVLTDGTNLLALPVVRSPKRREESNAGPNTDGMGAYLPVDDLYPEQVEEAIEAGIRPVIDDMRERGLPYVGVLYADVMFTRGGPKILEYNCRFGETEVQAMVRAMDDDLLDLFEAVVNGTLDQIEIAEPTRAAAVISMLASSVPTGDDVIEVTGVGDIDDDDIEVFLGDVMAIGRSKKAPKYGVTGQRVLSVTAIASYPDEAAAAALSAVQSIEFDGMHYRRDVAVEAGALV